MGRGCLRETAPGAGAERGRERAEFAGLRARASFGRVECACVRCVFACGHSSRHQPLSLIRGSELFLFFAFGVSSFLNPLSSPSTRTPCSSRPVGASDSQTQVRRAQRASPRSRFPQAPDPCGPPTRRSLSGVRRCRSAEPSSPWRSPGLTGTPLGSSPRLSSFDLDFTVTRPLRNPNLPHFAGGCRRPRLAPK